MGAGYITSAPRGGAIQHPPQQTETTEPKRERTKATPLNRLAFAFVRSSAFFRHCRNRYVVVRRRYCIALSVTAIMPLYDSFHAYGYIVESILRRTLELD